MTLRHAQISAVLAARCHAKSSGRIKSNMANGAVFVQIHQTLRLPRNMISKTTSIQIHLSCPPAPATQMEKRIKKVERRARVKQNEKLRYILQKTRAVRR
jgi:hypothetical protein